MIFSREINVQLKGNTEGERRIAKKKLLIYAHYCKVGKMTM